MLCIKTDLSSLDATNGAIFWAHNSHNYSRSPNKYCSFFLYSIHILFSGRTHVSRWLLQILVIHICWDETCSIMT